MLTNSNNSILHQCNSQLHLLLRLLLLLHYHLFLRTFQLPTLLSPLIGLFITWVPWILNAHIAMPCIGRKSV